MQILPVIHHLDRATTLEQAAIAREAGVDGVFLISHHGANDELVPLACHLQDAFGMRVGVNFLGWDNVQALDAAASAGIKMLWLDAPGLDSTGIKAAGMRLRDRVSHYAGDAPEIFASVAFKYQPREDYPAGAAHVAAANGFIPTTSGTATGQAPSIEKIKSMATPGKDLAIASGMTLTNVAEFAPYLSHILVATGVSSGEHHFDFGLLCAFIARARGAAA